MTYDKTCGNVRLVVTEPPPSWATIKFVTGSSVSGLTLEDLRDLHYLIGRALEASQRGQQP